jgi:hypothetical protein
MKLMVKGRVVDSVTGQPIEGAAVAIKWVHEKFALPGLGSNREYLGTTETLTDDDGVFVIPRYIWRDYYMGVYKEGYVCWSSETNFNPHGKTYEEMFEKRFWHSVTNGMTIQLETMPNDISFEQRKQHACFAGSVDTRLNPTDIFSKETRHEDELCFDKSN